VALPGANVSVCVLPSQLTLPVDGSCPAGAVSVFVAGSSLQCVLATLSLAKTLRGSKRGTIRSSTKRQTLGEPPLDAQR
jgi:hypothetical protein